jgi:hypothetical protein
VEDFFFWSATLCASPPPRPSILYDYSFWVHHFVNQDDRHLLAHAMANAFSVTWQYFSQRTIVFLLWIKLHTLIRLGVSLPSSVEDCLLGKFFYYKIRLHFCPAFARFWLCITFGTKWVGIHVGRILSHTHLVTLLLFLVTSLLLVHSGFCQYFSTPMYKKFSFQYEKPFHVSAYFEPSVLNLSISLDFTE